MIPFSAPALPPQIGFTSFDKWLTFSPAKNDLESAAAAAADGVPPGTASSAEAEFYAQAVQRLTMVRAAVRQEFVKQTGIVSWSHAASRKAHAS